MSRGDWMQTVTGVQFYPLAANVEDVRLADIANGLGNTCRFGGQCKGFYSVAEHAYHVSHVVGGFPDRFLGPWIARQGLHHDDTEAYLTDVPRPAKHSPEMAGYRAIEHRLWTVIARALHLPEDLHEKVKAADNSVLLAEKKVLLPQYYRWGIEDHFGPANITIHKWSPTVARRAWGWRHLELEYGYDRPWTWRWREPKL